MLSTLHIIKKLHVTPLCDIRHQEVANAYREGLLEQLRSGAPLVPVSSLVTCLQRSIAVSVFDGQHQEAARDFVGYHFGRLHGSIITATGSYRCDVATLADLDTDCARRGYLAGRFWFFYEATPRERRFSDDYLIERLHEIASECTAWHDPDEVWQFAIGCHVGELSGPVFPVVPDEQAYWEAEDQEARAWMAEQEARRDTEPLGSVPVVASIV